MPPKHTKHCLQANPAQPGGQANPPAPARKAKERATEKMLEKRSLNDAKLDTALDVVLDGLDEAASRRRRVDFGLNKRQWQEVCNLAQALGLAKNEAITRINQHTVDFDGVDAAGGSAEEEFHSRAKRHEVRRAKKQLKKKVQRDETSAAVDSGSTAVGASVDASSQLPQLAAINTTTEENQATEVAGPLPPPPIGNATTAQVAPILQQAPQETEAAAPSDDTSIPTSMPAAHNQPLANPMPIIHPAPPYHPTANFPNRPKRKPRREWTAEERAKEIRLAREYRIAALTQDPSMLMMKPPTGASSAENPEMMGSSSKRARTVDGDDDDDERTVKKRKLSTDGQAVKDRKAAKSRVRWAEHNAVVILPSIKVRKLGMRIRDMPGEPEPMLPPAPLDGAEVGKVKRHTDMGVPINEAPPEMERVRISINRRRAAQAELRASQSAGATVEQPAEPVANVQSEEVPQGEAEVAQGDGGDEVQEEVQEEKVRTEREVVHAQEHDNDIDEQEESFVSSLLETLSPTLQRNDNESLGEPEEISLEA